MKSKMFTKIYTCKQKNKFMISFNFNILIKRMKMKHLKLNRSLFHTCIRYWAIRPFCKKKHVFNVVEYLWNRSWRQITLASLVSKLSSQTVPQRPNARISTRPWYLFNPPASLNWTFEAEGKIRRNDCPNVQSQHRTSYGGLVGNKKIPLINLTY